MVVVFGGVKGGIGWFRRVHTTTTTTTCNKTTAHLQGQPFLRQELAKEHFDAVEVEAVRVAPRAQHRPGVLAAAALAVGGRLVGLLASSVLVGVSGGASSGSGLENEGSGGGAARAAVAGGLLLVGADTIALCLCGCVRAWGVGV